MSSGLTDNYDPIDAPWLTIVNYPGTAVTPEEIVLMTEKLQNLLRDETGPAKVSLALEHGVRFDRARSEILVALVRATYLLHSRIDGYSRFVSAVQSELRRRNFDMGFVVFGI